MSLDPKVESQLVHLTRIGAVELTQDVLVATAAALATDLRRVVIADEGKAAEVLDQVAAVKKARRVIDEGKKRLLAPHEAARKAVREALWSIETQLEQAEDAGKAALDRFEKIRAVEAQKRRDAEIAAQKKADEEAAATAKEFADDVPPPIFRTMAPLAAPPPRLQTSTAAMGRTSTLVMEIHNVHEIDPTWLKLDTVAARAAFMRDMREDAERLKDSDNPDAHVVYGGVRYSYKHGRSVTEPGRQTGRLMP